MRRVELISSFPSLQLPRPAGPFLRILFAMNWLRFLVVQASSLLLFSVSALATEGPAPMPPGEKPVRFNRDIKPILAENCFACHGADSAARKAKLRFDRQEGFFEKRDEDGPTVVKG